MPGKSEPAGAGSVAGHSCPPGSLGRFGWCLRVAVRGVVAGSTPLFVLFLLDRLCPETVIKEMQAGSSSSSHGWIA